MSCIKHQEIKGSCIHLHEQSVAVNPPAPSQDKQKCHSCENFKMFFQVATDALGFDPSCQPGLLDPMCIADEIRNMKNAYATNQATINSLREMVGEFRGASHIALDELRQWRISHAEENNTSSSWESEAETALEKLIDKSELLTTTKGEGNL